MAERSKKYECCQYSGDARQIVISGQQEGRSILPIVAGVLVSALLIAALCIILIGDKTQIAEKLASFSMFNGFLFFAENATGSEDDLSESVIEDEDLTDAVSETDASVQTDNIPEDESEGESLSETVATVRENTVTKDLSFMEYGDTYYVNQTDERIAAQPLIEGGFSGGLADGDETPQVLVIHTHTSETYWGADPENASHKVLRGVVAVGETLMTELNLRGIPTVHCTVIHDGDSKRDSYEKTAETIKTMLEIYPSLRYVVDLHRLSDCDENGLFIRTCAPDGSAQLRLTAGLDDSLRYDDLTLALCLRKRLNAQASGTCMPVVLTTGSLARINAECFYLKVDAGGIGNTVEEAKSAVLRFAVALSELLKQS